MRIDLSRFQLEARCDVHPELGVQSRYGPYQRDGRAAFLIAYCRACFKPCATTEVCVPLSPPSEIGVDIGDGGT